MATKDWKLKEGDYYWEKGNKYLTIIQDEDMSNTFAIVLGSKTYKKQKILKITHTYKSAQEWAERYMRKH